MFFLLLCPVLLHPPRTKAAGPRIGGAGQESYTSTSPTAMWEVAGATPALHGLRWKPELRSGPWE